jgi:hypothetical protein
MAVEAALPVVRSAMCCTISATISGSQKQLCRDHISDNVCLCSVQACVGYDWGGKAFYITGHVGLSVSAPLAPC